MKSTDPGRMSRAERLAEIGEILAAGYQRFTANAIKGSSSPRNSGDQLDVLGLVEAPCGSAMESPA